MVNYPHKVAKKTLVSTQRKHPVDFANRGMTFEKMINESNQYYLSRGLAVIHKKPTPIQIVKVDYPHVVAQRLLKPISGKPQRRTILEYTRDAISILKLRRHSKSSLCRMKNFHQHQIDHMEAVVLQGILYLSSGFPDGF